MAHSLFLGMTESGKTTLARRLAAQYRAAGIGVLVLDPLRDPAWPCDFITDDQDEFLAVFWASRRCMVFMDEGGESVGRYNTAMSQTVTRGRHWGHSCHVLAQRLVQVSPLVRDQCRHLFLFCSSTKDGELLAHEYNRPLLAECAALKQGEYFHTSRFGECTKHDLFSSTRRKENGSSARGTWACGGGVRTGSESGEENDSGESLSPAIESTPAPADSDASGNAAE